MKDVKNFMYDQWVYTINPDAECPIMLLNAEIGLMVFGDAFARELYTLDAMGKKCIRVFINSVGGSVVEGMSIYDAISNTDAQVDTYCVGLALSIAAIIFQAGDNRYIMDYGQLMYHDPYNLDGSEDKGLESIRQSLVMMISNKNGIDRDTIASMMNSETWINAEEAVSMGFADELITSTRKKVEDVNKQETIVNKLNIAGLFMNKFVEDIKNTDAKEEKMAKKEIKNRVKRNDIVDLSEVNPVMDSAEVEDAQEAVEEANEQLEDAKEDLIDAMEDESEESDGDVQDKAMDLKDTNNMSDDGDNQGEDDDDVEDKADDVKSLKAQLKACMEELQVIKDAKAKSDAAAFSSKVEAMLNSFVKQGRIKEDAKDKWSKLASANYDETVALIETLPVNKVNPKIDTFRTKQEAKQADVIKNVSNSKNFIQNKLAAAAEKRSKTWNIK